MEAHDHEDGPSETPQKDTDTLPAALRGYEVIDAHAHVFPPRVFEAVWRWFDRYGWEIRYRLQARETVAFLRARGLSHVVGLHYAHVPGMAAGLNRFVCELAREAPGLIACATVLPGEPGARAILDEALGPLGLRGVKIHCHVQRLAPDDPRLDDVYAAAAAHGVPVVIHAGNAPNSPHYGCDVEALCTPDATLRALSRHPRTQVIVPHLGVEHVTEYTALLDTHPNLFLDTTMTLGGFLPTGTFREVARAFPAELAARGRELILRFPDRMLYGSDFPNIPYAWDRELAAIAAWSLPEEIARAFLAGNARRLFGIAD